MPRRSRSGRSPGERERAFDPARGTFFSRRPSGDRDSPSAALYGAAQLVAFGDTKFLTDPALGARGHLKLATTLEAALEQGNGAGGVPRKVDL